MSGRVQGSARPGRPARTMSCFAALLAGGLIFGGVAVMLGAGIVPVLLIVLVLAAYIAVAVTK